MKRGYIISRRWAALLLAVLLSSVTCGLRKDEGPRPQTVVELDSGWEFREAGSDDEWLPATVPGTVHTDLLAAEMIPDPFFGDNEKDLQWIGEKEWVYRCTFEADDSLLSHERIFLELDGLDTYADVILNGESIISNINMFIARMRRVESMLKMGENSLEVRFLPTGPVEAEKKAALGYELPGGDRVFTRKAAYHYGWDWGPRFLTCGIWRPIRLRGQTSPRIDKMDGIIQALSAERAIVEITLSLRSIRKAPIQASLLDHNSGIRYEKDIHTDAGSITLCSFEFRIPDPQFWWPAGLGEQTLRRYTAEIWVDGIMVDSAELNMGLRTLELAREKDESGESFYMKVNGVPVFMKGANWVPLDSFLPRPEPDDYRRLLTGVKDANMNMLRVWGGGTYERDIFYELCDSLGILVWQDFMFACAMYPGDPKFLASTLGEATINIKRLRNRPCLAMWCGNNENDEGWHNWGWQDSYSASQRRSVWRSYRKLFNENLPKMISSHDNSKMKHFRPYIPSSPKYGRADPRSLTEGDAHYWGVWHDAEPFEILEEKIPRFMSEFGFQSFPSMETIEMFTGPDERDLGSDAIKNHQKHSRGFELIREYMERWYRVPGSFEDYVYVSQLLQAEGMRIGFEAQRRAMPYCMGSLYWQLNDCWPAISWSSIDYAGRWKALHYAAKKAFAPVLVSTDIEDGQLDLYIVSDRLEEVGGWMEMELRGFGGRKLWERTIAVKAPPNGSVKIFSIPLDELFSGHDRSAVVFSAQLTCPGEDPPVAIRYFAHPKDMALPDAAVTFEIVPRDGSIALALTSPVLAKNVFLHLDGCHFSDNFFDILPGETIDVAVDTDIPADEIMKKLEIRTLRDTY
jgi:beta-mannosidase